MPKKSNFPDFDPLDRPIDTVSRFLVFWAAFYSIAVPEPKLFWGTGGGAFISNFGSGSTVAEP